RRARSGSAGPSAAQYTPITSSDRLPARAAAAYRGCAASRVAVVVADAFMGALVGMAGWVPARILPLDRSRRAPEALLRPVNSSSPDRQLLARERMPAP